MKDTRLAIPNELSIVQTEAHIVHVFVKRLGLDAGISLGRTWLVGGSRGL